MVAFLSSVCVDMWRVVVFICVSGGCSDLYPLCVVDEGGEDDDAQHQEEHQQHQLFGGCPEKEKAKKSGFSICIIQM